MRDVLSSLWESLVAACEILVCRPGIEPGPPELGAWSLSHWTIRGVPELIFHFRSLCRMFCSHGASFRSVMLTWEHLAMSGNIVVITVVLEGDGTPLQCSCLENPMDGGAWWAAVHGVAGSRTRLSDFTFTFHFHALEKEMATHSSVLAWRIPGTAGPGGLPSVGSHRVGHD